jgi:VanZ family protein
MHFRYFWPGITWVIFILFLTGMPGQYIPVVSGFWDQMKPDKLVHTFIFMVLVTFMLYGIEKQEGTGKYTLLIRISVIVLSVLFGGGTELLQKYLFTNRTASWADFAADCSGVLIGLFVYLKWFLKPTRLKRILEKIT